MIRILLFSLFLSLSSYTYVQGVGADSGRKCSKAFDPQDRYTFEEVLQKVVEHNSKTSLKEDRIGSLSAYNKFRASDPRLPAETTLRKQFKEFAETQDIGTASLSDILFSRAIETGEIKSDSVAVQEGSKDVKNENAEEQNKSLLEGAEPSGGDAPYTLGQMYTKGSQNKESASEEASEEASKATRPLVAPQRERASTASAQEGAGWLRRLMGKGAPAGGGQFFGDASNSRRPYRDLSNTEEGTKPAGETVAPVRATRSTTAPAANRRGRTSTASFNNRQAQTFTAEELQNIKTRVLRNIQQQLLPEQISWLKPEQVKNLNFGKLTIKQVQALTEKQVQAIPPKNVQVIQSKLLPEQVAWLNEQQLNKIQPKLSAQQLTKLSTKSLEGFSVKLLTREQIVESSIEVLQKIGVHRLSVEQLKYLNAEKVQNLTQNELNKLNVEQMQSIQKHLSPRQIVELKEEFLNSLIVGDLTPVQVRILSESSLLRALPHFLNGEQLKQTSDDYIEGITGKELNKMNMTQLKAIQNRLSSSQLNEINRKLFKGLSFESLNAEQIENLPSKYLALVQNRINSKVIPSVERLVSDFNLKWMTVQQIQAMTVEQLHTVLNKMSGRQIQVLTNEQVDALLEDSVGLSSKQFRYLKKNLSVNQMSKLSDEKKNRLKFKGFTNATRLRQLQVDDSLTPREVRRLVRSTPEMAYVLSGNHLSNLSKRRLRKIQRYLLAEQIASLQKQKVGLLNMKLLSTVQVQAFTSKQLNFLSAGQLKAIQAELLPNQIADLGTSVLMKLKLKKLSKQQAEALTSAQLKALGYQRVYPIWDKLLPEQQQLSEWQPAIRRQR